MVKVKVKYIYIYIYVLDILKRGVAGGTLEKKRNRTTRTTNLFLCLCALCDGRGCVVRPD